MPVWGVLTGQAVPTNTDIAAYLLANVNGSPPDLGALNAAVTALETESFQGAWLANLAASAANQDHIGLVGVMETGLDYVAPPT